MQIYKKNPGKKRSYGAHSQDKPATKCWRRCGSKKPAVRVYRHATYLGVWNRRYDSVVPGFNRIPPPDANSTFKVKYKNPEGILDITQEDCYVLWRGVLGITKATMPLLGAARCGTATGVTRQKGGVHTTICVTHLISSFRTSLFANIQIIISKGKNILNNFPQNNSISFHRG